MSQGSASLRPNNFDLIRFFAAFQVLIYHSKWFIINPAPQTALEAATAHFSAHANNTEIEMVTGGNNPSLIWYLFHSLSGVPIFFVVSGFLISLSLERSPSIKEYFRNRALRIYPGLWLTMIVTLVFAMISTGMQPFAQHWAGTLRWTGIQATGWFLEEPKSIAGFGHGQATNPLWTIMVELEFYLMIPLFYWLGRRKGFSIDGVLGFLLVAGVIFNQFMPPTNEQSTGILQFIGHPAFRVVWMFLLGVMARRHFEKIRPLVEGKFVWWLIAHLLTVFLVWFIADKQGQPISFWGNKANPLGMIILTGLILSAAYSWRGLSEKLLRGNDLSYGVYIFNMPVICLILEFGIQGKMGLLLAIVGTLALSLFSWKVVELPALSLKKYSVRKEAQVATPSPESP